MHNRDENKLTQINLIKKVGMGNRKNNDLHVMAWKRGELDRGGKCYHL